MLSFLHYSWKPFYYNLIMSRKYLRSSTSFLILSLILLALVSLPTSHASIFSSNRAATSKLYPKNNVVRQKLNKFKQDFRDNMAQSTTPTVIASAATATKSVDNTTTDSFLKSALKMTVLFIAWYGFNAGCKLSNFLN